MQSNKIKEALHANFCGLFLYVTQKSFKTIMLNEGFSKLLVLLNMMWVHLNSGDRVNFGNVKGSE